MTLSDLERLAREATPGPWEWRHLLLYAPKANLPRAVTAMDPGAAWSTAAADSEFIAALDPTTVLALLQLARAVQDWSKIRHRGAADDDRLYQALAVLNLKDEI